MLEELIYQLEIKMFTDEEKKIWEKQNIKKVEEKIYEKSYKVNDEEDELKFLDKE